MWDSLLTPLHQLYAVLEEHVPVLVTEALGLVGHLSSVVLDCEPGREPHIVLLTRQLHPMQFLGEMGGTVGGRGNWGEDRTI